MSIIKTHSITGRQVFKVETPTCVVTGYFDPMKMAVEANDRSDYPYQLEVIDKASGKIEYHVANNPCIFQHLTPYESQDEFRVFRKATFQYSVEKRTKDEVKAGSMTYAVVATDVETGETDVVEEYNAFSSANNAAKYMNSFRRVKYV